MSPWCPSDVFLLSSWRPLWFLLLSLSCPLAVLIESSRCPLEVILNYLSTSFPALVPCRPGTPPGTRVTFSVTDTCGSCSACVGGPSQKCRALTKYGHSRHTEGTVPLGTYSSHILLGRGTVLVPLPPSLDTALAVPANCALAAVVAARRAALHGLQRYPGTGEK